ncbi:MAG: AmmeMemoRadiSam system radical SAM enzyme [Deltaproteobacteria bacterium]|nr:AmmeMemoRadiSam system radical SAM enzyme [Deltaproteobacteria bacterium]
MRAYLFEPLKDKKVKCNLCSHRCVIKNGNRGICKVRENQDGVLTSLVYGKLIAQHIDPIEKKPLFHIKPGSLSYSIATVGCNFKCRFCQNADIAQMPEERQGLILGDTISPEAVVADAVSGGCASIAYTYTEPTVYFEFAHDTARLAHEKGLKNVFVTNGYMTGEALEMIAPYLDGANVDLKAFSDKFYKDQCSARLVPVKETLVQMKARNILVEITSLLIPGLNTDPNELHALADFLVTELGPDTPWHISRFHPTYQLTDRPPTSVDTLLAARKIGLAAGLKYVYTGNVPGRPSEQTLCHQCGKLLIDRWGFTVRQNQIRNGRCPDCRETVAGIEMDG